MIRGLEQQAYDQATQQPQKGDGGEDDLSGQMDALRLRRVDIERNQALCHEGLRLPVQLAKMMAALISTYG